MDKYIELFIKTSESLPEEDCIALVINHLGYHQFSYYQYSSKEFLSDMGFNIHATHWLDLSKLTTKDKAQGCIEFALSVDNQTIQENGYENILQSCLSGL